MSQSSRIGARQIAGVLRERVRSGEYKPDSQIPSVSVLAEEFSTSLATVSRALDVLRHEGLVQGKHGRGVYVRTFRRLRHPLGRVLECEITDGEVDSFETATGAPPESTDVEIDYRLTLADELIAAELGVEPDAEVLRRRYTFMVDGDIHQITTSWLSWERIRGTELTKAANERPGQGTTAQLRSIGVSVQRVRSDLTARMPSPEEARALGTLPGTPIFEERRRYFDARDELVCVADTLTPADRIVYGLDVARAPDTTAER